MSRAGSVLRLISALTIGGFLSGMALGETAPSGAPAATQPAGPAPKLRCDQPVYEAPEVWSGDKIEHTFIIANDGDAPLEILNVQPACGCTVMGQYDKVIEPKKEGKLPLAVNTARMRGPMPPKQITVTTNDPQTPRLILVIKGTVKPRIAVEPMAGASWGQYGPQSPDSKTVTVTNNTDKPFNLEFVPETQPAAAQMLQGFEAKVVEKQPGKVAEVIVSLKKPVREGWQGGQLRFKTGIPEEPEVFVPCNVSLPPAIQVSPTMVTGVSTPGQEFKQTISIRYNRQGTMKITEVKASDPAIVTQLTETQPGTAFMLAVTLPAGYEVPMSRPTNIEISTDVPTNPKIFVPVRVRPMTPTTRPSDMLVGKQAPLASLKGVDGEEVKFGGNSDEITVVNFWASWCPICRRQLPILNKVAEKFDGKGVRFINVSTDGQRTVPTPVTTEDIRKIAQQHASRIPVALDPKGEVSPKYSISGLPTLYLLNKNGVIEAAHTGAPPTLQSTLESELSVLLAGKTRADFPKVVAPLPQPQPQPRATQPAVSGPSLKLDGSKLDAGAHKPGDTVRYYVNYRNQGTEPLTVNVKPGAEIKIDPEYPRTLAPGASSMLRCEFLTPKNAGPFSHELVFETNDPANRATKVVVTARAQGYIEYQPATGISFPRTPRTQTIPAMATLLYNGEGTVEYPSVESTSPKFEAKVAPVANSRYSKLIVTAKPPFPPGENTATIRIKTTCKEQPLVEVPVKLFSPPRIAIQPVEPRIQSFPRLQRVMVTLQNNGDKPFGILGIKASDERIRWQFYPDADGLSYKMMLTVALPDDGKLVDPKVTIRTDDPEFGELIVPIKINEVASGT